MVDLEEITAGCNCGRDAWIYNKGSLYMASRIRAPSRAPYWGALELLGKGSPGRRLLQTMLMSVLLLLPLIGAEVGVHSDSVDQRLTISITPLPADSGYPFSLHRQVQLQCDIDTEPAIDIGSCGWRFNYGEHFLINNNKYTLYVHPSRGTVHSLTMILTINGITEDQLGFYTCEGKNSAGLRKSSTVELAIVAEDTVGIKDPVYEETTGDFFGGISPDYNMTYNGSTTVDPFTTSSSSAMDTLGRSTICRKLNFCIACFIFAFIIV